MEGLVGSLLELWRSGIWKGRRCPKRSLQIGIGSVTRAMIILPALLQVLLWVFRASIVAFCARKGAVICGGAAQMEMVLWESKGLHGRCKEGVVERGIREEGNSVRELQSETHGIRSVHESSMGELGKI